VTAHPDRYCKCSRGDDDAPCGTVNPDAPGYPLVLLVDAFYGDLVTLGAGRRNAAHRGAS
jgi:hypothetical protein